MGTLLFVLIFAALSAAVRALRFELTFLLLLITPILTYLVGGSSFAAYVAALLLVLAYTAGVRFGVWRVQEPLSLDRIAPFMVWAFAYSFFYNLCLLWPEFMPMGERLRDYALLAGVLRDPINVQEPWFAGNAINYYVYWYRVGHMLSTVSDLPVWETYHQLQAFTFALFLTALYELGRRFGGFTRFGALLSAVVICLGSNVKGVQQFLAADANWWGPSRVIEGAINEFPAWSFLLGDVHPHYLNLGLLPLLVLALTSLTGALSTVLQRLLVAAVLIVTATTWMYNANGWEIPVVLGLTLSGVVAVLIVTVRAGVKERTEIDVTTLQKIGSIVLPALLVFASCFLMAYGIKGPEMPLTLVAEPVKRTPVSEFMLHWGGPFWCIAIGLIGSALLIEAAVLVFLLLLGWYLGSTSLLLSTLIAAIAYRAVRQGWAVSRSTEGVSSVMDSSPVAGLVVPKAGVLLQAYRRLLQPAQLWTTAHWTMMVLGGSGLVFVLFPEFLYFNDSYGTEIDRMNTIFKFYSASWFMLHLFGFYLLTVLWKTKLTHQFEGVNLQGTQVVVAVLMLGFFYRTIDLRMTKEFKVQPYAQGLSQLDAQYSGAAKIIQELEKMPLGVTLETQGGAYNLSTHVATLSNKPAYLGWTNHVGLLARDDNERKEIARREQVTKDVYGASNCEDAAAIVEREKIEYLIVGPLERVAYPALSADSYKCLQFITGSGEYLVFRGKRR